MRIACSSNGIETINEFKFEEWLNPPWTKTLISPQHVEGIEVYRRPAELPAQYSGARSGCGVILTWSRGGGELRVRVDPVCLRSATPPLFGGAVVAPPLQNDTAAHVLRDSRPLLRAPTSDFNSHSAILRPGRLKVPVPERGRIWDRLRPVPLVTAMLDATMG